MIYKNITELIGKTPLMELTNFEKNHNIDAKILAKLEYFNPAGSAKDRVGKEIIFDGLEKGTITKDSTIIEPTSGNTGIGIAAVATSLGMKAIIVMPDSMSIERINLMKAYGAKVVLTPGQEGMAGALKKADELNREIPQSVIAGQFENPANPQAHIKTTGPEIWEDTEGKVDIFVAGIGTGGTITGVGTYLKSKNPNIKIVGVEPLSSPVLTKGVAGAHKLQGIGANFVPEVLDRNIYDEIITVKDEDAYSMGRAVAREEGVLVGITSGAVLSAACDLAERKENKNKNIVVFFPDSGERYLSTKDYLIQ